MNPELDQSEASNPLLFAVPPAKPTLPEGARIVQIYRGKVGCCCGCNGTHISGEDLTPRRITNVLRDLADGSDDELRLLMPSGPGDEGHLCRERNGRYVIAYFQVEASPKVVA